MDLHQQLVVSRLRRRVTELEFAIVWLTLQQAGLAIAFVFLVVAK